MERFAPIEGLRAWLARAVFFGHIATLAGLSRVGAPTKFSDLLANTAVQVFMIVSGFVITHLLVTRHEAYRPYITRRFFRLFPVYVVCSVAGYLAVAALATPWPNDASYEYVKNMLLLKAAQRDHLPAQILLHLTMLHGAVPNNVLMDSQYAFLPPAWSVSLEWQFYLVAPLVLWAMKRPAGAALVVLATLVSFYVYGKGVFGQFRLPSLLFGSGYFFLFGVACRLFYDRISPAAPLAFAIAVLGFGYLWNLPAIGIWSAFFVYMFCDRRRLLGADRLFVRFGDALFASEPAKWMGQRTYCIYLVHFPILLLLLTGSAWLGLNSPLNVAAVMLVLGFPLTMLAAEALHRAVELPGMRMGHGAAQWRRVSLATAP